MQTYQPGGMGEHPNQGQYPQQPMQPQQPMHPQSQTVIVQNQTTRNTYRIAETQVTVHGAMHIVFGILSMIFNIVLMGQDYDTAQAVGAGVWVGIYFVMTGAFGISAAKQRTQCFIITYMVLCIINTIMALTLLAFGAAFVGIGDEYTYTRGYDYYNYGYYYRTSREDESVAQTLVALGSLLIIMSFIEIVISIWSSALCCAAVCCMTNSAGVIHQQPIVTYNAGVPGPVVHIHTNPQPGYSYNPGQPTCITQQGNVPVHMPAQGYGPPSYNQPSQPYTNNPSGSSDNQPAYTINPSGSSDNTYASLYSVSG